MREDEFIRLLQRRAREQKETMEEIPFPKMFSFVLEWLSIHPMRLLIPVALLLSIFLRYFIGHNYTNFVLTLFRWAL